MGNPYTNATTFLDWMPQRYLAELSNDTSGFTADNAILDKALDWGAGIMESKLRVRDDIPIPAINADNTVPDELRECVHDLALFRLFNRRGMMKDEVQTQFDMQMTWLDDIVRRRANIDIRSLAGRKLTRTNPQPVTSGDEKPFGERGNEFTDKWTF